jgi:sugar transferase (PEP-CTERM/EpsH1 system associated)
VLTPKFPSPTWGAGTRNYYFLKALAKHHTVSLLTLIDKEEEREEISLLRDFLHTVKCVVRPAASAKRLKQLVCMLRGKSYFIDLNSFVEVQEALNTLLAEEHYHAVLFESALMSDYRLPEGVKRIIDEHNVEYELLWRTFRHESGVGRKWFNWWENRVLKPAEIALCKQADLLLATSKRDCAILKNALPTSNIQVVPNGVDTQVFQNSSAKLSTHQIIFTGTMNYYPNIDAVSSFAKKCWPLIQAQIPDATWLIVGRDPPQKVRNLGELPGVTVTGSVPDARPYLAASAVAIAPLQVGSGTRLKILEAFAMGKAVVSTSIGCEGLAVVPEEHLLLADSPEEFAQAVIKLLNDADLQSQLGMAGRRLVEAVYSWEHCSVRLLEILENSIQERERIC